MMSGQNTIDTSTDTPTNQTNRTSEINRDQEVYSSVQVAQKAGKSRLVSTQASNSVESLISKAGVWTQWGKEKIGKAAKTEESKEFVDMVKRFQTSKKEIIDVWQTSSDLLNSNNKLARSCQGVTASFAKLGSHSKSETKSSEVVQAYVPFALKLEYNQQELNKSLQSLIVQPLTELVTDMKRRSDTLLAAVGNGRLLVEHETNNLRSLAGAADDSYKKQQAMLKLDSAKVAHQKAKDDLTNLCDLVETRKNMILHTNLAEYVQKSQFGFFAKGAAEVAEANQIVTQFQENISAN